MRRFVRVVAPAAALGSLALAQTQSVTPDLSNMQTTVVGLLAIGAAIVGSFVLFKIGKRAANRI